MDLKFSIKNMVIATLMCVVGILLLKWAINKAPFPDGIKASVNAI